MTGADISSLPTQTPATTSKSPLPPFPISFLQNDSRFPRRLSTRDLFGRAGADEGVTSVFQTAQALAFLCEFRWLEHPATTNSCTVGMADVPTKLQEVYGFVRITWQILEGVSVLCNYWKEEEGRVWGLSVCMCVFPASLLFFFKKERKKKTKLNTKECVKSSNANRSGAFGRLLKRQRSKCVQLNCLHSGADKTAQASSTQNSGRASGWMLLSPKEAIITHIPARIHSRMGRGGQ